MNKKHLIPSAVANPVSHEPLRRMDSFAAATIMAALAIWATTNSNALQSLFLSLSYAIHRIMRSSSWSTVHRKQLYQQRSPAPHAPSLPPSQASLLPSHRPRTTRHPPASATTTLMISGKITQQTRMSLPCRKLSKETWPIMPLDRNNSKRRSRDTNSSSETRRRRRRHRRQNGPRRRRRRRRERRPSAEGRHRYDAVSRRTPSITTAVPLPPFPLPRRYRRRLSQWFSQPQRSRSPIYRPRAVLRKFASWSAAVTRTAESPLSSTVPLEGRGSRER